MVNKSGALFPALFCDKENEKNPNRQNQLVFYSLSLFFLSLCCSPQR